MDAKTALETVLKPKLTEVFGTSMGGFLVTKAFGAGISGKSDAEKLQLMVESICSDPKVIGMWGASQTARQKGEWLCLVK
jgi:hypothetical protein